MGDWERYYRDEEIKAMGQAATENLAAIIAAYAPFHEDVAGLGRALYKYTDCGAHLSVLVDGERGWVHTGQLHTITKSDCITALMIGSIVEGTEACAESVEINLLDEDMSPEDAVSAFNAAVARVEKDAAAIWDETHDEEGNEL